MQQRMVCVNGSRSLCQGNCLLLGENFREIGGISAGLVTFGSDTDVGAILSAKEVESLAAQDGQVVLRIDLTGATVVAMQETAD